MIVKSLDASPFLLMAARRHPLNCPVSGTEQGVIGLPGFPSMEAARRSARGCFGLGLVLIAALVHFWGAGEARTSIGETVFITMIGGAWLLLITRLFPWLGLSARDDAVDRRNVSALVAVCGAVLATALAYGGGNIGEGPSYWNNIFSGGLGTCGLLGLWIILELGARVSSSIAEERDLASGVRLCGFLLATGLICGRAVAGNWHSVADTVRDFVHDARPAAALCAVALVLELFLRPGRSTPIRSWALYGLLPALLYLSVAALWLLHLGAWEGYPR